MIIGIEEDEGVSVTEYSNSNSVVGLSSDGKAVNNPPFSTVV